MRLLDGRADAAGFHCGAIDPEAAGPPVSDLVADPAFRVRPLFFARAGSAGGRRQPLGLGTAADLRATKARFVNRQKGSGTRAWFDRLLAEAAILPEEIVGYRLEEFTHQAVAGGDRLRRRPIRAWAPGPRRSGSALASSRSGGRSTTSPSLRRCRGRRSTGSRRCWPRASKPLPATGPPPRGAEPDPADDGRGRQRCERSGRPADSYQRSLKRPLVLFRIFAKPKIPDIRAWCRKFEMAQRPRRSRACPRSNRCVSILGRWYQSCARPSRQSAGRGLSTPVAAGRRG